jgi:hypothetical protein
MIAHGVRSPTDKRGFKRYDLRFVHWGELPIEGSNYCGFINNSEKTIIGLLTNSFVPKDNPLQLGNGLIQGWRTGEGVMLRSHWRPGARMGLYSCSQRLNRETLRSLEGLYPLGDLGPKPAV